MHTHWTSKGLDKEELNYSVDMLTMLVKEDKNDRRQQAINDRLCLCAPYEKRAAPDLEVKCLCQLESF